MEQQGHHSSEEIASPSVKGGKGMRMRPFPESKKSLYET
ncbi:hypothetical protein J2S09_000585 [Bacillus fengqiuensis]|nr:hypothetical protein [Bacillus fengqiuensis]